MGERDPDYPIDAEIVADLVSDQFPDLRGLPVVPVGAGWDNQLFSVGGDWIFRFPKRVERVPWLAREVQNMTTVSDALGSLVPRFERRGHPSATFPYPFVGYRRLPGVCADRADHLDEARLAHDLGRAFSSIHAIDPRLIPPTPAGREHEPWAQRATELARVADVVSPLLPADVLAPAEPYLAGRVPPPPQDGPRRSVHNDICPDHILVDSQTGRLSGLVDFTDAMVGDPVVDFVGLIGVGGRAFIAAVANFYDHDLGATFQTKLDWLTRVLALTWLAEANIHDPSQLDKHLLWVRRAFDDYPDRATSSTGRKRHFRAVLEQLEEPLD